MTAGGLGEDCRTSPGDVETIRAGGGHDGRDVMSILGEREPILLQQSGMDREERTAQAGRHRVAGGGAEGCFELAKQLTRILRVGRGANASGKGFWPPRPQPAPPADRDQSRRTGSRIDS